MLLQGGEMSLGWTQRGVTQGSRCPDASAGAHNDSGVFPAQVHGVESGPM